MATSNGTGAPARLNPSEERPREGETARHVAELAGIAAVLHGAAALLESACPAQQLVDQAVARLGAVGESLDRDSAPPETAASAVLAPVAVDADRTDPPTGAPEDFIDAGDQRVALHWWGSLTERQRAFWRGEAKADTLAAAWKAFNGEIHYWRVYQLPDARPWLQPAPEPAEVDKLRAAVRDCDGLAQEAAANLSAFALAGQALLLHPDGLDPVALHDLLGSIVERARSFAENVEYEAEHVGASCDDSERFKLLRRLAGAMPAGNPAARGAAS